MRADARRNREAILTAAREVFDDEGILASIDAIAARAGVGNATLYRNFPARDDLLAAVMEDSVRAIIEESADLDGLEADAALREWMFRLTWQLRVWQNLPTCIADAIEDVNSPVRTMCTRLTNRTAELLDRARDSGAATHVEAGALFELLTALSWGVDRFGDDEASARARVAFATAGVLTTAER